MSATSVLAPTLDLAVKLNRDGRVQGSYSFTNTSDQSVMLLDQLYRTDRTGNLSLDPELVYVFFEDGVLSACRQMVRVPNGMSVEWPEVPGFRKVGPHKSVAGTFVLPHPVECHDPYRGPQREVLRDDQIREILFSVGFFVEAPEVHVFRAKSTNGSTIEYPAYSHMLTRQNLVRSDPAPWPAL